MLWVCFAVVLGIVFAGLVAWLVRPRRNKDRWTAPDGQLWLCLACHRYGKDKTRLGDTSCFSNAILVYEDSIREEDGVFITAEAVNDPEAEIE